MNLQALIQAVNDGGLGLPSHGWGASLEAAKDLFGIGLQQKPGTKIFQGAQRRLKPPLHARV